MFSTLKKVYCTDTLLYIQSNCAEGLIRGRGSRKRDSGERFHCTVFQLTQYKSVFIRKDFGGDQKKELQVIVITLEQWKLYFDRKRQKRLAGNWQRNG